MSGYTSVLSSLSKSAELIPHISNLLKSASTQNTPMDAIVCVAQLALFSYSSTPGWKIGANEFDGLQFYAAGFAQGTARWLLKAGSGDWPSVNQSITILNIKSETDQKYPLVFMQFIFKRAQKAIEDSFNLYNDKDPNSLISGNLKKLKESCQELYNKMLPQFKPFPYLSPEGLSHISIEASELKQSSKSIAPPPLEEIKEEDAQETSLPTTQTSKKSKKKQEDPDLEALREKEAQINSLTGPTLQQYNQLATPKDKLLFLDAHEKLQAYESIFSRFVGPEKQLFDSLNIHQQLSFLESISKREANMSGEASDPISALGELLPATRDMFYNQLKWEEESIGILMDFFITLEKRRKQLESTGPGKERNRLQHNFDITYETLENFLKGRAHEYYYARTGT